MGFQLFSAACRRYWFAAWWIAVAMVIASAAPAMGQEPLLWGSLKPGPYAVGYKTSLQFDPSRLYDPDYVTDPGAPPVHKPRPILVCIWYPAQKTSANPMEYRGYLQLPQGDARSAAFLQRLDHNIRTVVSEETVGKEPSLRTPAESAAFERLMRTQTFAVRDAKAAMRRFPVIVYHAGLAGTHEDNSVLFELLASHGFVVLSSAYQSRDPDTVHISSDLHTSFRDMEFLCRAARGLPFADADRLGAMGHSWGAIAVLHWAALPDSPLSAFVTLDSGFEYESIEDSGIEPLINHMKMYKGNIRAAALRFASAERKADFEFLGPHLKNALRYDATVASLKHNDYLTHGAIRPALMPEKWPDDANARRTSYDRMCQHILYFFDATLKQQSTARDALVRSVRGEGLDDGFRLRFKPADTAVPTIRQLALYLKRNGVEQTINLLRTLPNKPTIRIVPAATVLLEDGEPNAALPALRFASEEHPKIAIIQIRLGQALALVGDRQAAIAAYRKANELLPNDETAINVRKAWQFLIDKGLKDLGQDKPISH